MKDKLMIIIALFALSACEEDALNNEMDDTPSVEVGDDVANEISFLTLDGEEASIYEFEDGMIVVSMIQKSSSQLLEDFEKGDMDLKSLYLELTGENEVPDVVLHMDNRLQANRSAVEEDSEIKGEIISSEAMKRPSDGVQIYAVENLDYYFTAENLSASAFETKYCYKAEWDKNYCYTNCTNNWYVKGYMRQAGSKAHVWDGAIKHKLRRKVGGSWHAVLTMNTPEGWTSSFYCRASGMQDYLKMEIYDAEDDGWHTWTKVDKP